MPAVSRATRYGTMNAPPPFSYAMYGKRQMLPSPTAEPMAARMNTDRPDQTSLVRTAASSVTDVPFLGFRLSTLAPAGLLRG